jgi:hypothetical protein
MTFTITPFFVTFSIVLPSGHLLALCNSPGGAVRIARDVHPGNFLLKK